jgi:Domain of unknown function (DUF4282)
MFCRQCGNRLELGSLFCAGCGAKATTPVSGPDPTREKGNSIFSAQTEGFFESLKTRGFFESLFDFSFTSLVTTKLIKVLYGLSIAVLALGSLFFAMIGFSVSPTAGAFMLIFGAPLFFLLGVCYTRVMLEIMIVVFRIAEHTAERGAR